MISLDNVGKERGDGQCSVQEDFVVSDVFTPQTIDDVDQTEQSVPQDKGQKPFSGADAKCWDRGFQMTGDITPIRNRNMHPAGGKDGNVTGQRLPSLAGPGGKAKKRKNKKRQTQEAPPPKESTNPHGLYHDGAFSGLAKASPATRPPLSRTSSGLQSSTTNGVSALRSQLESLNTTDSTPTSSAASAVGSECPSRGSAASDSDQTEILTTYEVPLEHDFVSPDADKDTKNDVTDTHDYRKENIQKKMCAEDFEPLTCLGKGTYGTVLLVKHKSTGALYAQKQFHKASLVVHKKLVEQTKTERAILESVNRHPFVVKLYYAFQDHEKLYLSLEYAQGGELFTHLAMERMFSEEVAAFYMAEMVLALEHIHHNVGVIYRDLKPENCLLDSDGHLLLTDFGLSKIAVNGDDRCNSSLGTVEYMAPEVIKGQPYGKTCDWWSLGAIGFDLLTGSPPFKGNNNAKITERILKQKLTIPYFLGPDAKDLLLRLLRKEPHKRLGYHMPKDMKTIKSHRFFRKIDWKALERRELESPIRPVVTDPSLAENFSPDFTSLPLSPVVTSKGGFSERMGRGGAEDLSGASTMPMACGSASQDDPFGGFSFVAPSSLLQDNGFGSHGGAAVA